MTAVGTTILPPKLSGLHWSGPKAPTQKGTNITKQMSVNRFRHKDSDWNRVAPTKSTRNFLLRGFSQCSRFSVWFDFFIAEIFAWGTSDSLEENANCSQRGRATYFVLNLLVHTNALLTVFRFRFHFVFSSPSFYRHCCCSLLFAPPVGGLKFWVTVLNACGFFRWYFQVWLSVCQHVCQSVSLSVSLSVCLSACRLVSCVKYLTKWPKQTPASRQSFRWFHGQTFVCTVVVVTIVAVAVHNSFMLCFRPKKIWQRQGMSRAWVQLRFVSCLQNWFCLALGCCDVVSGLRLFKP